MRRVLSTVACGFLLLLVGCGGGGTSPSDPPPTVTAVQVTGQSANLIVGDTQQMTAKATFSSGAPQDATNSATWSSSNTAVATVAAGGLVTAKASGQAVISAKVSGVSGNFNLTVAPALVSIAVTPANSTIAPQTTQQMIATGTFSDNSKQNLTSSVTWASTDKTVATVSTTAPTAGLASAVGPGSTTISATVGAISGSTMLTVSSASVLSIAVLPNNPTLPLGVTQQFTANATFSDNSKQDITGVATWQSSATNVVSITASGLGTAKNVGSSTVQASFGGMNGTSVVTVNAANLNSITIQPPGKGNIAQGTTAQAVAVGNFNDGSTRDITHQVTWTSDNTAIATVGTSNGIIFGKAPGIINLGAALGGLSASVPFNVSNATITSVIISPVGITIPTGADTRFFATGVFSDSTQQDITTSVAWSSSDTSIATVVANTSATPGFTVGVKAGTTNINATFTYAGVTSTGSDQITVSSATLSSLAITPPSAEVAPGSGVQFVATGTFSDGSTEIINPLLTWSSSNNNVASMNLTGFATGQSAGVVTITATAQSAPVSATAQLLVKGGTLTALQVVPGSASVPNGFRAAFRAMGTFSDGTTQDLSDFASWTSSNSAIATVSDAQGTAGQATGVTPGTVTITAAFSGQVGTASLTVNNTTLQSITVTPSNPSIAKGSVEQFNAVGTFSDGSSANINYAVTWNSSDPAVATINSQGLADANSSGTSTISATAKGVTGMTTLTVQ